MKPQSRFIKLPGERVNSAQVEAGVPMPDTYPAFFWIERADIRAIMEAPANSDVHDLTCSTIFCQNGDTFFCSLPAEAVMRKLDRYDLTNITYPFN